MKRTNIFIKKYGLLILIFLIVSFAYRFDKVLFLEPQSIHQWRQADCLSLAHNYIDNSNFLEPSIHNYISDGETSGMSAGELPILYYFIGKTWSVFGEHIFIYRSVTLLIFFIGLFSLFDSCLRLLKSRFWAHFITILLFTSPVLVYYSNNFLTNVPAFSLVLFGWNYFIRFLSSKKGKLLFFSLLFFSLAALLKMTAAISLIALFGIFILEWIGLKSSSKGLFTINKAKTAAYFSASFLFIIAWYVWAEHYNKMHGGRYTFNWLWPIWEMDKEQIEKAFHMARGIILYQAFNGWTLFTVLVMAIYIIIDLKNNKKFFNILIPIVFIGVIFYLLLWFHALDGHDYYIINLLILPLIIIVGFFMNMKKNREHILNSKKAKLLGVLFLVFNIVYASNNIRYRYGRQMGRNDFLGKLFMHDFELGYWVYMSSNNSFENLSKMEVYNRGLGIKEEDLIVYLPDESFNISLYLLNQKGWTSFSGNQTNTTEGIKRKIRNGAKFLILGKEELLEEEYLKPFLNHKVGEFEGKTIFKLN